MVKNCFFVFMWMFAHPKNIRKYANVCVCEKDMGREIIRERERERKKVREIMKKREREI